MAAPPTFELLRPRYTRFWRDMVPQQVGVIDSAAAKLMRSKSRYEKVGKQLGIPWWWIAICHNRESGGDFRGVLHNGEHIIGTGAKTRLVPAGRGPFSTWESAAVDALKLKGLQNIRDWSVERVCYEAERFNGFGYYWHGVPSAYLWSYSNIYLGGKYVSDGVWSPTARDGQLGVMPLLKRMMVLDPTIQFGRFTPGAAAPEVIATTVIVGGGGAVVVKKATEPETGWGVVFLIGAIVIAFAVVGVVLVRRWRGRQQEPALPPAPIGEPEPITPSDPKPPTQETR